MRVWIAAGGKNYAGKPRSAVIVQDDRFDGLQHHPRFHHGRN
jgi:hypothetical protein